MTGFLLQIQIGKKVTRLNDLLIDEPSPAMKISHNNTEFIAWVILFWKVIFRRY